MTDGKINAFIAGGAGFIGSHIAHRLLLEGGSERILIYDNFSSGQKHHIKDIVNHPKVSVIHADIKDLKTLTETMEGCDMVFHFASNPDIAKAMIQPDIDFWEGTYLTQNILEAMRINQVKRIIYASGSGVYGETGYNDVHEDYAPLLPISTYGASKLAGEALVCSYCHMFDITGRAYRFANVVGGCQTHGVAYDFIRKLQMNPHELLILGDGTQSKSYIFVEDIIDAIFMSFENSARCFDYFNVATGDYITVNEIADMVIKKMDIKNVKKIFSGGDRGWKGDVPVIRFELSKILNMGWRPKFTSAEAIEHSIELMLTNKSGG